MKKLLIVLLLLLLPVSGLAYEYMPGEDVSFSEPFSAERLNTAPGVICRTERAEYRFSSDIAPEVRDAFIQTQEKLLKCLDVSGFTCCVLPDYPPRAEEASRSIFLSPARDDGLSQAIVTLQALHGEMTHYGLIFAAADDLCRQAGLKGYSCLFNDRGMLRFYNDESNLSHFLLLYPSFTQDYTEKNILLFVRDMAVRFYAFLRESGDAEKLLAEKDLASFQAEYIRRMNDFLTVQGAETRLHDHLPALAFGCGGAAWPLRAASAHGQWYLAKDFDDSVSDSLLVSQIIRSQMDAGNTISLSLAFDEFSILYNTLWRLEDDMAHADACLALTAPQPRDFLFRAPDAAGDKPHYAGEGPVILSTAASALHEYIHALLAGRFAGENQWFLQELAATYFEMGGQISLHHTLRSRLWNLKGEQAEYWAPVLDAMEKGEVLHSWAEPEEIYGYLCFAREEYDLFTPSAHTLNALRSFSAYLRETYGDEKVGAALAAGDPMPALGRDWETLRGEWKDHLAALYGQGAAL